MTMKSWQITSVILVTAGLASSNASALEKLREWPSITPVFFENLKEQYEYDPAAGAGANGIHLLSEKSYPGAKHEVLIAGREAFQAYHGFVLIHAGQTLATKEITYQEDSAWPAESFSINYKVIYVPNESVTLNTLRCTKAESWPVATKIANLPGLIVRYQCELSQVSGANGNIYRTTYAYLYSTHFDEPLAIFPEGGCKVLKGCETTQYAHYITGNGSMKSMPYNPDDSW